MFKRDTLREWLLLLTIIAFFSGCRKETGPISPDTTPPYVISVESTSEIEVEVVFNERVESATAVDLSNYTIEGFSIYDATLENDQKTVMLIVFTDYPDTMFHVITVRNVKDLSENTMDEQSLTFSGWFKGLLVQAELIRATYYWTHIEESRVSVMEDGWWDDYSTVIVDGERLFLYIEGLYRVGMTLDSGRDYLLFMETSKGSIVTGSVKMTYPVEITTPTSGDTIPENQSLQVRWQYEGSPPESLLLFLGDSYVPYDPIYSVSLGGNKTSHSIPETALYPSPRPKYLTLRTKNMGRLNGTKRGSYYDSYDIDQVVLYIKE